MNGPDINDTLRNDGPEGVRKRHDDAHGKLLAKAHATFRKWLDENFDLDVIGAVLATAASEQLTGDALWLLVVAGSGLGKTEVVRSLEGAGAHVTSTIASEGALLSATPRREKVKGATGGLLRKIGERGILVVKDVTSILSADRNTRGAVLAALREIHDRKYERNVGTDGGRTLTWTGRITVIGAVTTAWDAAHAVIAACGDRFVLIRADTTTGRTKSARKAIGNTGGEVTMRKDLAQAVGELLANVNKHEYQLTDAETEALAKAADIVTWARTGVERDYRGEVIDAHAPEMPTRFAKQLTQLVRGAVAIGMSTKRGMELAIRCARDSIPPLRREILLDIAANPSSQPRQVNRRIKRPRSTVRRELEALYMLRLLQCDETDEHYGGKLRTRLHYSLANNFDRETLLAMTNRHDLTTEPEPPPENPPPQDDPPPEKKAKPATPRPAAAPPLMSWEIDGLVERGFTRTELFDDPTNPHRYRAILADPRYERMRERFGLGAKTAEPCELCGDCGNVRMITGTDARGRQRTAALHLKHAPDWFEQAADADDF